MVSLPTLMLVAAAAVTQAPDVSPHYEHLQCLNVFEGEWELSWKDEKGKIVSGGEEKNEWVFNKSFMKATGWYMKDGKRIDYIIFTGWDPVKKKIIQWGAGSSGGHVSRVGSYEPATKTFTVQGRNVGANGTNTYDLTVDVTNTKTPEFRFRNSKIGDEAIPDLDITFTRKGK